jgi:hypothetical protein
MEIMENDEKVFWRDMREFRGQQPWIIGRACSENSGSIRCQFPNMVTDKVRG